MYKLFLVEDDTALAAELKSHLESFGNSVVCATKFSDITSEFREAAPDLVLMDIMLPFKNGYYWTAEIRKISKIPIVFLSSASDNMNIVMAMNMGGDDFIPKPVDPMVLNAKICAVLRRTYEMAEGRNILEFCGATLNLNDESVLLDDRKAELTKNEFRVLLTLLENRGKIVSRDTLMFRLWNEDFFVEENTLTVNVTRLRKKLEELGMHDVIKTRPGSGYMIEE